MPLPDRNFEMTVRQYLDLDHMAPIPEEVSAMFTTYRTLRDRVGLEEGLAVLLTFWKHKLHDPKPEPIVAVAPPVSRGRKAQKWQA